MYINILRHIVLIITFCCFLFIYGCEKVDNYEIFYEIDESYFEYPFDTLLDYYIISAWRILGDTVPAYTPEMVATHTKLVGKLPWVTPTSSANLQFVIGQTSGWPKNPEYPDDPEIPPQNIYGYQITDLDYNNPKVKVVLTAGQHSTEFPGNYALEGMVNFLAGSDPRAVFLRRKAVFYVYPDINPEGRYMAIKKINLQSAPDPNAKNDGRYRGNPELYAAGEKDHNRVWLEEFFGKFSTIDLLIAAWEKDFGNKADYLWDMHGPQPTGNWRSPSLDASTNAYAKALMRIEPELLRCGPPGEFKAYVAYSPPGKIGLYALDDQIGLHVKYPYVYEGGPWTRERLLLSGKRLAIAFYEVLNN
ncbi:MAG: M14 family zinc carboxypeptidase [Cyclobacteriaceae bacterium]